MPVKCALGFGEGEGGRGLGGLQCFSFGSWLQVKTAPFVIDIIMIDHSGLAKFASQGRLSALVQYHSLTGIV